MPQLVGVLDNVRSRYNVGAIFRTADGLGVSKLYLCGITPCPDRTDDLVGIAKTALGAEATVPWEYAPDTSALIQRLRGEALTIVALETAVGGVPLPSLTSDVQRLSSKGVALIVGHEVYGIRHDVLELADIVAEIPMHGTKRSLNVEVSFALGAYTISRL